MFVAYRPDDPIVRLEYGLNGMHWVCRYASGTRADVDTKEVGKSLKRRQRARKPAQSRKPPGQRRTGAGLSPRAMSELIAWTDAQWAVHIDDD